MTRKPTLTAGLAALVLLPAAAALLPAAHATPGLSMQADPSLPLWGDLQGLGLPPARWAELLTGDADGNGLTDFLDVAVATAAAHGALDTRAELLAYAPDGALAALQAAHPDAVPIEGIGAAFLTAKLSELPSLRSLGATLLVWEPRTAPTACPALCNARTLAQSDDAATLGFDGTGVTIAVLDGGVDYTHPAFAGTTKEPQTVCAPASGIDHGTHVASIALGDDPGDFAGVATGANLWSVTAVGTLVELQCAVDAVRGAHLGGTLPSGAAVGPLVATGSFGLTVGGLGILTLNGGQVDLFGFDRVAEKLPLSGVPFTIAAGNWLGTVVEITDVDENTLVGVNGVNQVSSPGFATQVITVGAVSDFESRVSFSALGPGKLEYGQLQVKPDVMAHGLDTWGADQATGGYIQMSGTSMATPGVAGVVALLLDANPSLTPAEVKAALHDGAETAWLINGLASEPLHPDFANGWGLVRAPNSLALV